MFSAVDHARTREKVFAGRTVRKCVPRRLKAYSTAGTHAARVPIIFKRILFSVNYNYKEYHSEQ